MLHFECDYTQGFEPKVMEASVKTNLEATSGYGLDKYSKKATEVLKQQAGEQIAVHYLVGGTQTNMIVINSLLHSYQGSSAVKVVISIPMKPVRWNIPDIRCWH